MFARRVRVFSVLLLAAFRAAGNGFPVIHLLGPPGTRQSPLQREARPPRTPKTRGRVLQIARVLPRVRASRSVFAHGVPALRMWRACGASRERAFLMATS